MMAHCAAQGKVGSGSSLSTDVRFADRMLLPAWAAKRVPRLDRGLDRRFLLVNVAVFAFFQEIFSDIIIARIPIAVTGSVLPLLCGFLYMVLLRVPGVLCTLVWGSILLVFLVLVAIGAVCWDN